MRRGQREQNVNQTGDVIGQSEETKITQSHCEGIQKTKDKDIATVLLHKIDQCDRDKSKTIIVWGTQYIWRMYRIFVLLSASNVRSNLCKILCALHVFPVQYLAIECLVFPHWYLYIVIHLNRKYCHDLSKLFFNKMLQFLDFLLKIFNHDFFSGNN